MRADRKQGPFRAGYVAIIGRPNAGKSTLLNRLVGEKVAAVTAKPQTTRDRIAGIVNLPGCQAVFLDTPGIHPARDPLNRLMVEQAVRAAGEADLIYCLVEGTADPEAAAADLVRLREAAGSPGTPALCVLTKIDLVAKQRLLPLIGALAAVHPFAAIIPVSALRDSGIGQLLQATLPLLPEGEPFFPDDQYTDRSLRFLAAEIIREKAMRLLHEELPYATAVAIDAFEEPETGVGLTRIAATIHVERESQKGIVIGRGGAMLKRLGSEARVEIEQLLGGRVFLELFVRVEPGWTKDVARMRKLGYS